MVMFLIGSSLFIFISVNTGSAAGLEVTPETEPEPEQQNNYRVQTHAVARSGNDSKPHTERPVEEDSQAKPTEWIAKLDDESSYAEPVPDESMLHETEAEESPSAESRSAEDHSAKRRRTSLSKSTSQILLLINVFVEQR
ncbi:uncharacterized protein LOC144119790 [Amblyomma americanum]